MLDQTIVKPCLHPLKIKPVVSPLLSMFSTFVFSWLIQGTDRSSFIGVYTIPWWMHAAISLLGGHWLHESSVCVCVCVRACVRACACVHACFACVCMHACMHALLCSFQLHILWNCEMFHYNIYWMHHLNDKPQGQSFCPDIIKIYCTVCTGLLDVRSE